MPRPRAPLAVAGACCLALLSGCDQLGGLLPAQPSPTGALVDHVSDGDSLIVTIEGTEQRVRLLGVDAPERGECGHGAASDRLAELVADRRVELVSDFYTEPIDRHGRLLVYVEIDGLDAGLTLIEEGYVAAWWPASAQRPERGRDYLAAQRSAEREERGSWASCEQLGRP